MNWQRNQEWQLPFTSQNARQAVFAFKGDVYVGLDAYSLSEDKLAVLASKLRILSGLYGMLRPLDLIQPYRLEMGTKLENAQGNNLYDYWGSGISEILNEDEEELIVNLASKEYIKAIDKKALKAQMLDIAFKERKNDAYKIIGIYAKRARGLMISYIIRNRVTNPEELKEFAEEGYQFKQELSDDLAWVYVRD